jgi:hypothetical protein
MASSVTNVSDQTIQRKDSNTNGDDLRISRSTLQHQQQNPPPFILKTGNRSNSAHES